jgi:hypothetical protein
MEFYKNGCHLQNIDIYNALSLKASLQIDWG